MKPLWMRLLILLGMCLFAPYVYWLTNDSEVATKIRFLPFSFGLGSSNLQNILVGGLEVAGTVLAAFLAVLPTMLILTFRPIWIASALTLSVFLGHHLKFILLSIAFGSLSLIAGEFVWITIYFISSLMCAYLVRRMLLPKQAVAAAS
jgi:hypothetical protein